MKKFFKEIWLWAVNFVTKNEEKAKKFAKVSITITNAVKTFIDSPLFDLGTLVLKKAIPGEADDILIDSFVEKAQDVLPKLIAQEAIVLGLLENSTIEEKANFVLSKIKFANDIDKDQFYHNLCIKLIVALSDGVVTYSEAVLIAEVVYRQMKLNELKQVA